jgi:hypothetical protein
MAVLVARGILATRLTRQAQDVLKQGVGLILFSLFTFRISRPLCLLSEAGPPETKKALLSDFLSLRVRL